MTSPTFSEDIERLITETLLHDTKSMSNMMCLVARRFHTWAKPFVFHTVRIQKRNPARIKSLVSVAQLIRVLVISLSLGSDEPSHEELEDIRQLVIASTDSIRHLAIRWHLWNRFKQELGALRLESLCLLWDFVSGIPPPTFDALQHPEQLKDLTIHAPSNANDLMGWRAGGIYLPDLSECTNLRFVTYASPSYPSVAGYCEDIPSLEGVMFVWCTIPEEHLDGESMDEMLVEDDKRAYAKFSTGYLRHAWMVLVEWLAKVEGRKSVFDHPPPHEVEIEDE